MALSNSQYEAIMRIYNQRQFQNKRNQDERVREVYAKVPQVEALTDEITATMAQAGRYVLMGDTDRAEAMKQEAALLKEQKALYLDRNGYPADYLDMKYHCPKCRDTGRVDGQKCHCFKQMEIEILYDQSNIREVLERENFDTLSMEYYDKEHVDPKTGMTVYEYMSMVIEECKAFVKNFGEEKGSILFTGNTGCGKTFLSNCIARELIRRSFSVVYLTATDMFDVLSESRFGSRDEEEARDRAAYILECDLLIVDDLGTELINTFTASQLFYCVNERLNRKKGTIISTNLALNQLQDEFTERVTSRIMSQYKVMPLLGEDLRFVSRGFGK
ncbi:MAG: ATP-binding protein [Lachnospiraceae bacterium]|nr:ATP-binding protein [Lachnospiraceae bacterium]